MRILRWAAHIFRSFDCGRVALPTLDHISSGPPKIPYVRFYRGREQACACPPAQIPACALTHGAPTSDDDERPLVKPRALKPVAVTRETPTQGRHRKCVLHYLNRQCRSASMTLSPQTEYGASFSLPDSPLLRPFAPLTPQGVDRPLFACFTATMTASDFFRSYISVS